MLGIKGRRSYCLFVRRDDDVWRCLGSGSGGEIEVRAGREYLLLEVSFFCCGWSGSVSRWVVFKVVGRCYVVR